ncbi:MAG: hypothetical protein N2Z74_07030, partial [Syntrophales bacterium]|nr:hypothetical protein [Syntrophales bacterium]
MWKRTFVVIVLGVFLSLWPWPCGAATPNLIVNGDFSAGLQGWTVVPTGEPAPWPLVGGGANLHPSSGGYTGTVIYQEL